MHRFDVLRGSYIIQAMEKLTGKWLAAVSGGPDSMALLAMCLASGTEVEAAHVNYHHRTEADEEEAYVRSFCLSHGLPCHVYSVSGEPEGNFEAEARKIRYEFFARLVRERNLRGVLIAHHEDDLIETYLMQEEKNLVPEYYGLKADAVYHGMRVKRPLLSFTKKALEEYCQNNGIRYYIDQTNLSDDYTRNRIRHETVEKLTPFERNMILREIRQKNAVMQERRCRVRTLIRDEKVSLTDYRRLDEDDRMALLRDHIDNTEKRYSLSFMKEIDGILMRKNDFIIPVGMTRIVQSGGFFFLRRKEEPYCDLYETAASLRIPSEQRCYEIKKGVPGVNAVSVREDDFPLKIRSFQPGDSIRMRFGTKQAARFFVDRHIPQYLREIWPVVENAAGEIILLPGLGCSADHYSAEPDFNVIVKEPGQ